MGYADGHPIGISHLSRIEDEDLRKGAERILRAAALLEDENEGEKEEDWSNSAVYSALARDDAMQRLCVKALDGFIASRDREG